MDNLSFENWLNVVFDAKWTSSKDYDDGYFWVGDPLDVFVENCLKLFEDPAILLERFSAEQLEAGFYNFILSPRVGLDLWLWNKKNPAGLRRGFILSSVNVFEQVFTKVPVENSCFMWWDCLRGFAEDKDLKVADWMFAALSQILEIDSRACRLSALHGLGHIEHKGKKNLIEKFLRQNPDFDDKEYALAAIEGKVL